MSRLVDLSPRQCMAGIDRGDSRCAMLAEPGITLCQYHLSQLNIQQATAVVDENVALIDKLFEDQIAAYQPPGKSITTTGVTIAMETEPGSGKFTTIGELRDDGITEWIASGATANSPFRDTIGFRLRVPSPSWEPEPQKPPAPIPPLKTPRRISLCEEEP